MDLIERLRGKCKILHQCVDMRREAADALEAKDQRIEELEAITREAVDDARLLKIHNERLRAAIKAEIPRLRTVYKNEPIAHFETRCDIANNLLAALTETDDER